jgi:cation transporter-like permease
VSWINLSAIWKIVVYGLLAGAGLPALFTVGLVALSRPGRARTATARTAGAGTGNADDALIGGSVIGQVIAAICFLVVLAAIGWGVYKIYQLGHPATTSHK